MKKLFLTLMIFMAMAIVQVGATTIYQNSSEINLNDVWFSLFGENYSSSQALFDSRGVADGADYQWVANDGAIHMEFKDSAFNHQFGFQQGAVKTPIQSVNADGFNYETPPIHFTSTGAFNWYTDYSFLDPSNGYTMNGTWYSVNGMNSDGLDRFVALEVSAAGRTFYNSTRTGLDLLREDAFMLAFEDWPTVWGSGDNDYNDVVYLLDRINPAVPEPATMLLFGMSFLGLLGFRKKR